MALNSVSRRGLFSSLSKKNSAILLPYTSGDSSTCRGCEDRRCVEVCEEKIVVIKDNIATLDFSNSGCTFCKACQGVCELLGGVEDKIEANVSISTAKCLAWNGTMCYTCKDSCQPNAIEFFGLYRPVVEMSKCTACGFCVGVCPVGAVEIRSKI